MVDRDVEIRFVPWGIANNFGNFIEIHEDLPKANPKLYRSILNHELRHKKSNSFIADMKVDMRPGVKTIELLKFAIKRPNTWIQFMPFYWQKKKGFVMDINRTILYLLLGSIFGAIIYMLI